MTSEAPQLYKNFPIGCTDKELTTAISEYANEITKNKADINVVLQCSPLIQLGLGELQGRFTKRTMWASLVIAVLSIILSALALYVSIKSLELSRLQIDQIRYEKVSSLNKSTH